MMEKSYKELMQDLNTKINMLNQSDLSLEDSLKIYEEAMDIFVNCEKRLKEAEGKLIKIRENAEGELAKETLTADAKD